MAYCKNCGKKQPDEDANFCPYCGKPLVSQDDNKDEVANGSNVRDEDKADLILEYARKVNLHTEDRVFLKDAIPQDKRANAIRSMSKAGGNLVYFNVLILVDNTVWGGSKEGMIITHEGVYIKEFADEPMYIPFSKISSACRRGDRIVFSSGSVDLYLVDKSAIDKLVDVISYALNMWNGNSADVTSRAERNMSNGPVSSSTKAQSITGNVEIDSLIMHSPFIAILCELRREIPAKNMVTLLKSNREFTEDEFSNIFQQLIIESLYLKLDTLLKYGNKKILCFITDPLKGSCELCSLSYSVLVVMVMRKFSRDPDNMINGIFLLSSLLEIIRDKVLARVIKTLGVSPSLDEDTIKKIANDLLCDNNHKMSDAKSQDYRLDTTRWTDYMCTNFIDSDFRLDSNSVSNLRSFLADYEERLIEYWQGFVRSL